MARRGKGHAGAVAVGAVAVLAIAFGSASAAATADAGAGGNFPRFESLRADRVNLRAGPGARYPIEWVFTRRDMPIEVLATFEHWRKVRDWQGTLGWVEEKMIWGRREVIVTGGIQGLHQSPDAGAPLVARAQPGVIGRLLQCQGAWCRIEAHDISGWVRRDQIWGVLPEESVP